VGGSARASWRESRVAARLVGLGWWVKGTGAGSPTGMRMPKSPAGSGQGWRIDGSGVQARGRRLASVPVVIGQRIPKWIRRSAVELSRGSDILETLETYGRMKYGS
jgi:hypothetical protein